MQRRSLLAALTLALTCAGALSVSSATAGTDQVPVTQDEHLTLWAGTTEKTLNLLADDSDPEGERLRICRFGDSQPDRRLMVDPLDLRRNGRVEINIDPTASGTYTYGYKVCDHSWLVQGTLTVDVQPVGVTTVEKVPDDLRKVRVTNPDQHDISFVWWPHRGGTYAVVDLAPGESKLVRAGARRIDWVGVFEDGETEVVTGYGTVGGLTASRPPVGSGSTALDTGLRDVLRHEREAQKGANPAYDAVDPTTVAPPLTEGDEVHWWAGAMGRVDVLANDSDPQGQSLDVCRVAPSGRAVSAWTQLDNTGFTVESSDDSSGTYTLTYYACNDARLAPGTVTVHLRQARPIRVTTDGAGLRITNRNGARVRVSLTRLRDWPPVRQIAVRVPAHGERHVAVAWHRVSWYAQIGHPAGFAGYGQLGR